MAANSLRPHIVRLMAAHRERSFTTEEIYKQVAASGVPGFDPKSNRDRNLVNRELSDLAGCSAGSHSKPSPQLLTRVGRGRYIFNEVNRPMDLALVQEYLEPQEVYEKRPPRKRGAESRRESVPDSVRMALTRCSAVSARAVGSTDPTTCGSTWTTSWPWPTTGRPNGATCNSCAPTATG